MYRKFNRLSVATHYEKRRRLWQETETNHSFKRWAIYIKILWYLFQKLKANFALNLCGGKHRVTEKIQLLSLYIKILAVESNLANLEYFTYRMVDLWPVRAVKLYSWGGNLVKCLCTWLNLCGMVSDCL